VESQGPPSAVIATAHQLPTPSDSTVSATCQQLSTAPICVPEALSVGSGMGALAIQEAGDFDAMLASRDITPPWTLSDAEFAPVFAQLTQEFEAAQAEMNAKDDYDEPDLATLRLEATYCLYRADSRCRDVKVNDVRCHQDGPRGAGGAGPCGHVYGAGVSQEDHRPDDHE